MKNTLLLRSGFGGHVLLLAALLLSLAAQAQTSGFHYQAVVRDASGNPLAGQSVTLRFQILYSPTQTANPSYEETETTSTGNFGEVALVVGDSAPALFDMIQWNAGSRYLQVAMQVNGVFQPLGDAKEIVHPPFAGGKELWILNGGILETPYSVHVLGDLQADGNVYFSTWAEHFLELQNGRKRIAIPADPNGAMIFYTHSDQIYPRWEFRDLLDELLLVEIKSRSGDAWFLGNGSFKTVEVRGADIIEKAHADETLLPGEVVVFDPQPNNPNNVRRCYKAYDKMVFGAVSGAGGISHGMVLSQQGVLDGNTPIAIAGRLKVKVTGKVAPGDLLTTSNVPGHAMKVKNRRKAYGAVIGKALSYPDAEGLVLMLVHPQ